MAGLTGSISLAILVPRGYANASGSISGVLLADSLVSVDLPEPLAPATTVKVGIFKGFHQLFSRCHLLRSESLIFAH